MKDRYTADWNDLIEMIANPGFNPTETFLIKYSLQATVHTIWRERNSRSHGEQPHDVACLITFIYKAIRLKLHSVKGKGHKHLAEGLMAWFGSRGE
ncbi:unnamed protein product [Brassica rapa]|uniref:Uncharacterized protein n=1 Tax=Brassica campestris TaxID=3711 RepID=A0A3P6ADZ5_BRACM|nr:unnamed protein product [Brassica rapa]VDC87609.1 unnamed protein product [Brassica rapa]